MSIVVTCPRGHVSHMTEKLAGCTVRCPKCDEMLHIPEAARPADRRAIPHPDVLPAAEEPPLPETPVPEKKPKGLWNLIGKPAPGTAERPPEGGIPTKKPPEGGIPAEQPAGRPRSLWSLMQSPAAPIETRDALSQPFPGATKRIKSLEEHESAPRNTALPDVELESAAIDEDDEIEKGKEGNAVEEIPPRDRRLKQLPPQARPAPTPLTAPLHPELKPKPVPPGSIATGSIAPGPFAPGPFAPGPFAALPSITPMAAVRVVRSGLAPSALRSLIVGGVAVLFTMLAVVPAFWSKLPATVLGMGALILGFQALQEIKVSRGKQTGLAMALGGIALGVIGALLGPAVLSRMGIWEDSVMRNTEAHLIRIGAGLLSYHDEHAAFPPGGTFSVRADGKAQLLHGWMTLLLPYVGHAELFDRIDRERPFDDSANFAAMSQLVPEYLAAGASPAPAFRGLGVSHFAGVGGEVPTPDGGYAHAGIFGVNSNVTREDVIDGLSHTLVAGEIAIDYPAWGSPENWRLIGKGLNQDRTGFGNARGNGAHMLMADGSVRFFSNSTDRQLLEKLSTRDGEEEKDEGGRMKDE